jgi:hypothetical protein
MLSLSMSNSAVCHIDIWNRGGIDPPFLTSTLDGGEWRASRHGSFTPGERDPSTHYIGGDMGPGFGLNPVKGSENGEPPECEFRYYIYTSLFGKN